jgi:Ca-activated chloride channel homolog
MRQIILTIMVVLGAAYAVQAQTGAISGTVYDETKQPLIGAVVQVLQGGITKGGDKTDVDGKYTIKPLKAGQNYEIKVRYVGYKPVHLTGVVVSAHKTTYQNFTMEPVSKQLQEVVVKTYKVPMISRDQPGSTTTLTSEQVERLPSRNTHDRGRREKRSEREARIAGARAAGTVYMIDGVQVNGSGQQPVYFNPSKESYKKVNENDYMTVKANPLSTLSIDVDRASYSNVRRFINNGQKPPADAVRIEEMVNYFHYNYPQPKGEDPIAIVTEVADCPWNEGHKLLRVGMQARTIDVQKLPPSNLVFLIDVSGSMQDPNKLPLVKESMKMLVNKLRSVDKVAIAVYAGKAGLVLPSTPGNRKEEIIEALERLQAGGSTAGGAGIKLAYKTALEHFIEGGNNRVILATDGDFNVGVSGDNELEDLIVSERKKGIFLTCLGYGMGNYKDSKLETLADKGNGNYAYIDGPEEAEKTLVTEFGGTLFTIAKDVKAQIEFNPAKVQAYRLVGYENRLLNEEDFKDDKKDAGEMGSGHQVTILYEIIPAGRRSRNVRETTELKYQYTGTTPLSAGGELATIKFRYKQPDEDKSREMVHVIQNESRSIEACSADTRFASSVALFGMLLRHSKFAKEGDMQDVVDFAKSSMGPDEEGYRSAFIKMVKQANSDVSFSE